MEESDSKQPIPKRINVVITATRSYFRDRRFDDRNPNHLGFSPFDFLQIPKSLHPPSL